jgi:hypothetical protein
MYFTRLLLIPLRILSGLGRRRIPAAVARGAVRGAGGTTALKVTAASRVTAAVIILAVLIAVGRYSYVPPYPPYGA